MVFSCYIVFSATQSFAQDSISPVAKTYRIAVFAPVYLDSVFGTNMPNLDKSIPKFIIPYIEFIQGARIALDTLSLKWKHA